MNNYTKILESLKQQINQFRQDYFKQLLESIQNHEDKKIRIQLLKQIKILAENSVQNQKELNIQLNAIKPYQKNGHQRGSSSSTFFDNFKSVSQANSCVQSRQLEVFNEIKSNYSKQIQQKEIELIKIKNERYRIVDTIEDLQYELIASKKILQMQQQRLSEQEKQINNYFTIIEKIKAQNDKQKKPSNKPPISSKSLNNSIEKKFSFGGIKDFFSRPKHHDSIIHTITSRSSCFNQSREKIEDQKQEGTFKF